MTTFESAINAGKPVGHHKPKSKANEVILNFTNEIIGVLSSHDKTQDHKNAANVRLNNVGAMIRGLKEGSAAQFRMVQGQGLASGKMGTATGEVAATMVNGGLIPSKNYTAISAHSEISLKRAAASGLEVHNYGVGVFATPFDRVAAAQNGGFASKGRARLGRREGRSKRPEFSSHTKDGVILGADPDDTFGRDIQSFAGSMSVSTKTLRSTTLPDRGDDVMTHQGFDDDDGYNSAMGMRA